MNLPNNLTAQLNALKDLNLSLRQQLELAEAQVPPINEQIAQLVKIEMVQDVALLGEVVYDRAYTNDPHPDGSSLILQAALIVPHGLGMVAWDREEYLRLRNSCHGPGYADSSVRFVPFNELGSALKAILLPHAEPLLERLLKLIGVST